MHVCQRWCYSRKIKIYNASHHDAEKRVKRSGGGGNYWSKKMTAKVTLGDLVERSTKIDILYNPYKHIIANRTSYQQR